MNQSEVPIISALLKYNKKKIVRFHMPGHKGNVMECPLASLLGNSAFKADVTNVPGMDDLHQPHGVIKEAQELAAQAYGADATFFLVNGSSCGLQALIMATCNPGDKILVPRNAHRSVLSGIILSGAYPIYYLPEYNSEYSFFTATRPEVIQRHLLANPDIKAVLVIHPTYQGLTSNISAIAAICHNAGIPLLVDEAHGPHLKFHKELPDSALDLGADAVVHGTHKILTALTQASMLHIKGSRIDKKRLSFALKILQSTSTSYLLLASLDSARWLYNAHGKEILDRALSLSAMLRDKITDILDIQSFDAAAAKTWTAVTNLDATKVTIGFGNLKITGFQTELLLRQEFNVQVEMADLYNILLIITACNAEEDLDSLVSGLKRIIEVKNPDYLKGEFENVFLTKLTIPELVLSPRMTISQPIKAVELKQAAGRICAETIACYPPGIPILCPGERITKEIVSYIILLQANGGHFQGCFDTTLTNINVLE